MIFYVLNDSAAKAREAFVVEGEETAKKCMDNYSRYYIVDIFDDEETAKKFCNEFNDYKGEPDVNLSCCSRGCVMTAFEYAHRGDGCVYEGEFDDDNNINFCG